MNQNLTKKQIWIFLFVICILVSFLFYIFSFQPKLARLKANQLEEFSLESTVRGFTSQNISKMRTSLQMENILNQVPSTLSEPTLIRLITKLQQKNHLHIVNFAFGNEQTSSTSSVQGNEATTSNQANLISNQEDSTIQPISVLIKLDGNYFQISNFLNDITKIQNLSNIPRFTLIPITIPTSESGSSISSNLLSIKNPGNTYSNLHSELPGYQELECDIEIDFYSSSESSKLSQLIK